MTHHTRHHQAISAPPQTLYDLVADTSRWPAIFGPTVHVEQLERSAREERFQLWATVNGRVRNWTSRRTLDRENLRISFDQEHSQPPITAAGGQWHFRPGRGGGTDVELLHHFAVAGDDPGAVASMHTALDHNSHDELAALARVAEPGHDPDEVIFSFTDKIQVPVSRDAAYEFIYRADRWPARLAHVRQAELAEDADGVQHLRMETVTRDGAVHTTSSVRVCMPGQRIAYKQHVPPVLLFGHSGQWHFTASADSPTVTTVTADHLVAINPAAIHATPGIEPTMAAAREHIRSALGANSRATLAALGQ